MFGVEQALQKSAKKPFLKNKQHCGLFTDITLSKTSGLTMIKLAFVFLAHLSNKLVRFSLRSIFTGKLGEQTGAYQRGAPYIFDFCVKASCLTIQLS